ncbi:MAG: KamA family radical SAM protein [Candidatus Latescibacteria bacterium]|nr:KamA family radical SAM protein [Candidatus Latescibacterota bacterium]NIO57281.1 KamA family radical SAM protein [Candidatus Latescibacterota bacterium]
MSITDPSHPMYVPEENREIARERAKAYVEMVSDYLEIRDTIPTGFNQQEQIQMNRKRILKVLGGNEREWDDWNWHFKNAIRDTAILSKIIQLTDEELQEIEKTGTQYRWSISPYFASLMDPEDRDCPIRKQVVPTILEYLDKKEIEDPYAIIYNSPAPLITRLYADRLIINATNICSVFCRHCLRKKDIDTVDRIYPKDEMKAALQYIKDSPEIRDVLITGGDALILSDDYLDWILSELEKIPHIEIMRLGSRMIATLPQRVTPELCEMLSRHNPVYLNTQFNHPKEITPEAQNAVDRLIRSGVLVGNQSVLLKGINNDKNVMKKLVHELLRIRVRPYYIFNCKKLQGIRHFRAPIADGLNIMENLRGYTSGLAVPTFIITAPEGKGKTPLAPTYLLNINRNGKVLFRTWGGYVCEYEDEIPGENAG